jgi:phosphonate transport system substrate-binding protein
MFFNRLILCVFSMVIIVSIVYCLVELFGQNSFDLRYTPKRWVELKENNDPLSSGEADIIASRLSIRVAIAPVISPEKSLVMYQWLVDYLGAGLDRKAFLIQRQSYAEINDLIRHGGCDTAFICTYPFVQAERDFGAEILVVPQINGKNTYQSYIIVSSKSNLVSMLYLRGKRFASSDILSNSGWLFPAVWLLNKGEKPEVFFGEHVLTGGHDRSVMAVATEYVDGAAVDSLIYEFMLKKDPSLSSKIKIIMKSPNFGMPPVVVHPKMDSMLKQKILNIFINMHNTPGGKKVLTRLGIDRFVLPDDKLYDGVRKNAAIWETYRWKKS